MSYRKTYSFRVQPQDVDFQYNVTMSALANILLTTAGYNADDNGFGIRFLNEKECTWVLIRFAVEMIRFPQQYEDIQVEKGLNLASIMSFVSKYPKMKRFVLMI